LMLAAYKLLFTSA